MNKTVRSGLKAFLFSSAIFACQSYVLASGLENPIAAETFQDLLALILKIVIAIGTPVVIMSIIFVGFKFVTAQGNQAKIEKAKEAFFYVMIGAAIVIGCNVIVAIIQDTVSSLQ
jgi:hypothetical protein